MQIRSATQSAQGVTSIETEDSTTPETADESSFDSVMMKILNAAPGQEVHEEELFAGLIYERIYSLKGEEAAERYRTLLDTKKDEFRRADGRTRVEDAARDALKAYQDEGGVTLEEANKIHSEAFAGAQLDADTSALFDDVGGTPGDVTRAVAALEQALLGARVKIEEFSSGSSTADLRDLLSTVSNSVTGVLATPSSATTAIDSTSSAEVLPQGQVMDGADGFLFKPISNNQGKLAVLLPAAITGQVLSVILKDSSDEVLEEGRLIPDGIAETGREKYNFTRKGAEYPRDLTVEVHLANGEVRRYKIPDPSKRYD